MFDTILQGGTIYDGSGREGYVADIGMQGGKIAAIGNLIEAQAQDCVDVTGLAVSPGFIDLHTHSDFTLLANGRAESQVHQGVTTEVVGQCGFSSAPVKSDHDAQVMSLGYKAGCVEFGWRSFGEYLDKLDKTPLGVNVAAFVGHGTLYRTVLGNANVAPSHDQVRQMAYLLEESLEQGASGFSSGLEYWPGRLAAAEHLIPLCEVVARHDVLYATHVRNRDIYYDLGFCEALSTARVSGARLQISHIQPKFGAPPYAMQHTLEMIESARRYGTDVAFDVIPHNWAHTSMMQILPSWALEGGGYKITTRLKDPKIRALIKQNPSPMWRLVLARRWGDIVLLYSKTNAELVGHSFEDIGAKRGKDPYDCVFDLLLEEEQMDALLWTSQSFSEGDIRLCLQQPECGVISDTLALAPYGVLKDHIGSLSGYGWAARFLQNYVRTNAVMSLSEGVRRLTSLPAERLQFKDRGSLRPGFCADVTVFDPTDIQSRCSVNQPRVYATGIAHVLVNGEFSMRHGERTDIDAGSVIRSGMKRH
jgi:N-acyl-D-aspartate/D-glutamate deacylase